MKKYGIIAVLICSALVFSACGREIDRRPIVSETLKTDAPPERRPYPISVDGETFEQAPQSVVSLSPALTEILFDIGAGEKLSAVGDYCDYPAEAEGLIKAGSPASPNAAAIAELSPELLITQSPIASTDELLIKQAGVRVMTFSVPKTYAELCELYINLSAIFFGETDSVSVAYNALSGLDSALQSAQALEIGKSFVVVEAEAEGGLMLSPTDALCSDMLSVFGQNLWQKSGEYFADSDELFVLAPDIVFYAEGVDEDEVEDVFPHSKLIEIDFERFERPTARLGAVISECAEKLK